MLISIGAISGRISLCQTLLFIPREIDGSLDIQSVIDSADFRLCHVMSAAQNERPKHRITSIFLRLDTLLKASCIYAY